jgi:hypothetical protein
MKFILLFATIFSLQAFAIPHHAFSFKYKSFDGQVNLNCKHVEINEWYDWKVYCGQNQERVFHVHLKVSKLSRSRVPHTSYEVLYWITEKNNDNRGGGTTMWFHIQEKANFHEISMSQSVDNDTAGLYLKIKPY